MRNVLLTPTLCHHPKAPLLLSSPTVMSPPISCSLKFWVVTNNYTQASCFIPTLSKLFEVSSYRRDGTPDQLGKIQCALPIMSGSVGYKKGGDVSKEETPGNIENCSSVILIP